MRWARCRFGRPNIVNATPATTLTLTASGGRRLALLALALKRGLVLDVSSTTRARGMAVRMSGSEGYIACQWRPHHFTIISVRADFRSLDQHSMSIELRYHTFETVKMQDSRHISMPLPAKVQPRRTSRRVVHSDAASSLEREQRKKMKTSASKGRTEQRARY